MKEQIGTGEDFLARITKTEVVLTPEAGPRVAANSREIQFDERFSLRSSPNPLNSLVADMCVRKGFVFANAFQEFGAENRATGHKLVLRVEKVF